MSICTFAFQKTSIQQQATFIDLSKFYGEDVQAEKTLEAIRDQECSWRYHISPSHFGELPSCQFTYQLSDAFFAVFQKCHLLSEYADVKEGLNTGNNDLFFRCWWEVSISTIQLSHSSDNDPIVSGKSWFPCNRGGKFRRWYGNNESVIEWSNNGRAIKNYRNEHGKLLSSREMCPFILSPESHGLE